MGRRAKLAHVVQLDASRPVLVTHAGVTTGELAHLNCINATPRVIAAKLNSYLDDAVDAVRQNWSDGIDAPLTSSRCISQVEPGRRAVASLQAADHQRARAKRFAAACAPLSDHSATKAAASDLWSYPA